MKTKKYLNIFVWIIIFIKITFLLLSLSYFVVNKQTQNKVHDSKMKSLAQTLLYWKKRMEFIYIICMSLLIIFIFSPRHNREIYITTEMIFLFYLFGIILIITSDWKLFFTNAKWYGKIQHILR